MDYGYPNQTNVFLGRQDEPGQLLIHPKLYVMRLAKNLPHQAKAFYAASGRAQVTYTVVLGVQNLPEPHDRWTIGGKRHGRKVHAGKAHPRAVVTGEEADGVT